ncbi:MAG TPA: ATP-binding protein [Nonomuraea sp.]|nr:ATP-binding protein [Nonomuraea sp.]
MKKLWSCVTDWTVSWWLAGHLDSVPTARHLTRATLVGWGLAGEPVDIAELLVSELVGNAVEYSRGRIRLSLAIRGGTLRVEVEDGNPEMPHLRHADVYDEAGRGLFLVDALSQRWGGGSTPRGKAVWFELPTTGEMARAPGPHMALA